jgi:hypothetical protein
MWLFGSYPARVRFDPDLGSGSFVLGPGRREAADGRIVSSIRACGGYLIMTPGNDSRAAHIRLMIIQTPPRRARISGEVKATRAAALSISLWSDCD